MGVPVITLAGTTHASRVGVSLLTRAGLAELIASSRESYIRLAVEHACDLRRLDFMRQNMRRRLQQASLLDAQRVTRDIEQAYRAMWRRWCGDSTAR